MDIFLKLYAQLLPVIAFIGVGYFLKKKFNLQAKYVTKPLIHVLLPILVLYNVSEASISKITTLPIITFILAMAMNLPAILAYKTIAKDSNPYLLKSSFAFFNVAFFGIPTITALFGPEGISTLICIYLGTALYGDTIGYYQVAHIKLSTKDAVKKVLKIPFLYVFIIAIGAKLMGVEVPKEVEPVMGPLGSAVSALGMMVIGLHLTKVEFRKLDFSFFSKVLGLRIVAAAFILGALVWAEYSFLGKLETIDYQMLALVPLFPVAANVTVFASFLKTEEEQSALLILLSLAASIILVPVAAQFF